MSLFFTSLYFTKGILLLSLLKGVPVKHNITPAFSQIFSSSIPQLPASEEW
jgi:hypothetical protein